MARRLAEGKTRKEVMRCLKRYVLREVHTAITHDLDTSNQQPRPLQRAA